MHVLAFHWSKNSRGKNNVFAAIWQPESGVWQLQWHTQDFVISAAITNLICVGIVVFVIRCELVCFRDCQRNLLFASSWNKHGFSAPHMSVSLNLRLYWRLQHCWCQEIFVLFWLRVFSLCLWDVSSGVHVSSHSSGEEESNALCRQTTRNIAGFIDLLKWCLVVIFYVKVPWGFMQTWQDIYRKRHTPWERRENSSELNMLWEGWWR